jgi:hypothetical protein
MITKIKLGSILICSLFVASCVENSDGSDATTYSSCSITSSGATFASDRARDVSQCWDGVDYEEKSLALSWCGEKVNTYMGRYIFGHSIQYVVSSTNCP